MASPQTHHQTGLKDSLFNIFGTGVGLGALAYDLAAGSLRSAFGAKAKESEQKPLMIVRLMGFDHE